MAALKNRLGKPLVIYLGGAWVIVEAISFLINQYDLDQGLISVLLIFVVFGLFATLLYHWFQGKWNKFSIPLQILNFIACIFCVGFFLINPSSFNPSKLRVIKLSSEQSTDYNHLSSIAVLPFENFMGDESQEYLLAGMQDGLINEIGKLKKVRIISRTSTLKYRNSDKSISRIAEELNVDAIMESSLTRVDTLIELRLKLIEVLPEERQVWEHSYQTTLGNIHNIYREVTKNVALNLLKSLSKNEEEYLSEKKFVNAEAYDQFLRAVYYNGELSLEGYEKARKVLQGALAIDSSFAPAYAGLAFVTVAEKQMGVLSSKEADPEILSYLRKIYDLDPSISDLYFLKAVVSAWSDYNFIQAEVEIKKSIEMNPNDAVSRACYAHILMIQNRWKEAWEQMDYAMEIDPASPWVISFSGVMYVNNGKIITGMQQFENLGKIYPDHNLVNTYLFEKYASIRNYDRSIVHLKKMLTQIGLEEMNALVEDAYEKNGFKETIMLLLQTMKENRQEKFIASFFFARTYAFVLQDKENTLYWMEKMKEENDPNLPYLAIRGSGPYQDDPRYIKLMQDAGFW